MEHGFSMYKALANHETCVLSPKKDLPSDLTLPSIISSPALLASGILTIVGSYDPARQVWLRTHKYTTYKHPIYTHINEVKQLYHTYPCYIYYTIFHLEKLIATH